MENEKVVYTELEKKIIRKGIAKFRKELAIASSPMHDVLSRYGLRNGSAMLAKITLRMPYSEEYRMDDGKHECVNIPSYNEEIFAEMEKFILDTFLKEYEELKLRVDELQNL